MSLSTPAALTALSLCLLASCSSDREPTGGQSATPAPAETAAPAESAPADRTPAESAPSPNSVDAGLAAQPAEQADAVPAENRARARDVRVTILSTMLADEGIGEWGFSALVTVDGRSVLFDTGKFPDTVLRNARALDIDLSGVRDVVLSHHHGDHVGGLQTLRTQLSARNPAAMSRIHVAAGMFRERRREPEGRQRNPMAAMRRALTHGGAEFVIHERATELWPGVWLTGPVARVHDERNYTTRSKIRVDGRWQADFLPESQALVIDTDHGLVVIAGCGHAGLINTVEYARATVRATNIHAAIGGFHLFAADDDHLRWTGQALAKVGLEHFMGAHCTGIEAVFRIREYAGLSRSTAVVGAVGAQFVAGRALVPGVLAR